MLFTYTWGLPISIILKHDIKEAVLDLAKICGGFQIYFDVILSFDLVELKFLAWLHIMRLNNLNNSITKMAAVIHFLRVYRYQISCGLMALNEVFWYPYRWWLRIRSITFRACVTFLTCSLFCLMLLYRLNILLIS